MTLADLSDEIFRELEQPDDLSIPQISYWLQNNIGQLNVMIGDTIVYSESNAEFDPELSVEQANIFKYIYLVKYMSKKITTNLGAAAYDWSEITEGDTSIRRVSKNEVAKNYKQLRDAYETQLNKLTFFYKQNLNEPISYDRIDLLNTDEPY
jgi:hypothetical protein